HHRRQCGVRSAQLGGGDVHQLAYVVRLAVPGGDHQHDGGAQVGSDPRVVGELGGAGHVGVVRADDHHRIAPGGDLAVAGHDRGQGGLRVGVHSVVVHADALRLRDVGSGVADQQVQHRV